MGKQHGHGRACACAWARDGVMGPSIPWAALTPTLFNLHHRHRTAPMEVPAALAGAGAAALDPGEAAAA